jgi:hypothetical protein
MNQLTQNRITGIIAIGAVVIYTASCMFNKKTVRVDACLAFAMYAAGIFIGGLILVRGYHDAGASDGLYLMVLGAAVTAVSIQQGYLKLSAVFRRSKR